MYYFVFLLGLIFSNIKDKKNILFFLFLVILTFLAIFRFGVGPDYFSYQYLFQRLSELPINELKSGLDNQEVLFRLFGSIVKFIGFSYQSYLIIILLINLYFVSKICLKYSKLPILSLFLYYCFFYFVWTFSGLRQGLTISIGLYYLLTCIEDKKPVKLTIITILLYFIHNSAIVILLLYLLNQIEWNKRKLIYLSLLSVITSFLPLEQSLKYFSSISIFQRLTPYIPKVSTLADSIDFQSIARLLFLIIGLVFYNTYNKNNMNSSKIINIYIIGLNLYFILKFSEITASRISIYGFYLVILIIPNIYSLYKENLNLYIFKVSLITLSCLYFLKEINSMVDNSDLIYADNQIIPYTNIYNKYENYSFNKILLELIE